MSNGAHENKRRDKMKYKAENFPSDHIVSIMHRRVAALNKKGRYGITLSSALPELGHYGNLGWWSPQDLECEYGLFVDDVQGRRYFYLNAEDRDLDRD